MVGCSLINEKISDNSDVNRQVDITWIRKCFYIFFFPYIEYVGLFISASLYLTNELFLWYFGIESFKISVTVFNTYSDLLYQFWNNSCLRFQLSALFKILSTKCFFCLVSLCELLSHSFLKMLGLLLTPVKKVFFCFPLLLFFFSVCFTVFKSRHSREICNSSKKSSGNYCFFCAITSLSPYFLNSKQIKEICEYEFSSNIWLNQIWFSFWATLLKSPNTINLYVSFFCFLNRSLSGLTKPYYRYLHYDTDQFFGGENLFFRLA